jgi:hypothetical protein
MRRWLNVAGFGALALGAFGCSSNSKDNGGTGGMATSTGGAGGAINVGTGGSGNTDTNACASFVGLENCGTTTSEATLKKVNTLLVVDKSGSMSDQPPGYARSKWASLTQALTTVLSDTQKLMAYGLELFPEKSVLATCTDTCCNMPATGTMDVTLPGDVTGITTLLAETLPGGGTPTAQALRSALNYFRGAGAALQGQKVVFLATDGGPNCNANIPGACPIGACTNNIDGRPAACYNTTLNCCDPANAGQVTGCLDTAEVVTAIQALQGDGIPTVVLGLPGTESYATVLEQMAVAGDLPNPAAPPSYYAVNAADGVDGLTNTIKQITTQFINKCDIQLDKAVLDPTKVNVALDCNVLQAPDPALGGGDWILDRSTVPETVVLQGAVCDRVRTQGAQRIDVILGCPGVVQ